MNALHVTFLFTGGGVNVWLKLTTLDPTQLGAVIFSGVFLSGLKQLGAMILAARPHLRQF